MQDICYALCGIIVFKEELRCIVYSFKDGITSVQSIFSFLTALQLFSHAFFQQYLAPKLPYLAFQFPVLYRLDQIAPYPVFDSQEKVFFLIMGSHDDDTRVVILFTDLPDHRQPIHFRHVEVGDHQVGFHLIEDLQPDLAVFSNMKILHDAL